MVIVLAVITVILLLVLCGLMLMVIKLVKSLDTSLSLDPNLSLQEVLGSLKEAARLASGVAADLKINVAEARQQFTRLVVLLDRLQMDVTATGKSGMRIEADRAHVAQDLADLQQQARQSEAGAPGAIADEAAGGMAPKTRKPRAAKTKGS